MVYNRLHLKSRDSAQCAFACVFNIKILLFERQELRRSFAGLCAACLCVAKNVRSACELSCVYICV